MKTFFNILSITISSVLISTTPVHAKKLKTPAWIDPALAQKEHTGFKYQGEYLKGNEALQVVPEQNKFYVTHYQGGLPGNGWDGGKTAHQRLTEKELKNTLKGYQKINREVSSKPAPENAVILFSGKKSKLLKGGKVNNGVLFPATKTIDNYKSFKLHLEYRTPYKPDLAVGDPDRGNSGVFMLGLYEIQVADCFGLSYNEEIWKQEELVKSPNTCNGAIYSQKAADINMSLPALTWQSYDIDFTAPRFKDGKKVENARITVIHNGIKIHDNADIIKATSKRAKKKDTFEGPITLQKHGNPVQYRNIWLINKT